MDAHNAQVDTQIHGNLDHHLENGVVTNNPSPTGTIVGHDIDEKHPPPARRSFMSRQWLLGPLEGEHADLVLLAHSLATGLVDGASFSNWGVFVGMQTGNTVILGLSTATIASNPHAWTTTLVSILSYLLGAFLTFRLTNTLLHSAPLTTNRLALFAALLIQSLLLFLAAGLAVPANLIPHNPPGKVTAADTTSVIDNIKIVALIPPLAFQSGMQIAVSRLLGFNEMPVNVLTSTYCDLMGDMKILAVRNVKRNRRVGSVVLLLGGAIAAAWLLRSAAGLMGVLFFAAGVKFLAAVGAFALLPQKVARKDVE